MLVFDASEKLCAVLRDSGTDCQIYDAWHTESLEGSSTLEFMINSTEKGFDDIQVGRLIAIKDLDGFFQLFEVLRVIESVGSERTKEVFCENAAHELLDEYVGDVPLVNKTLSQALASALSNTRWEPGIVEDDASIQSTRYYRESVMSAIQNKMRAKWTGELRYRIEVEDNKITRRFVDVLKKRGKDSGKRFDSDKDLTEFEFSSDISTVKTAMYGYGRGEELDEGFGRRVSFRDVEWKVSAGDPVDKPIGQDWVGDPEALTNWGRVNGTRHRFGKYENKDVEDPLLLLALTWEALQQAKTPPLSYRMTVVDLERLAGYSHEAVRLGDVVGVIERRSNQPIRLQARVVEIKRSLDNFIESEITLENLPRGLTDDSARLKALEDLVNGRQGIWDESSSERAEYRTGSITDATFSIVFSEPFAVEPAIFANVYGGMQTVFTHTFRKGVDTDGATVITALDVTFGAEYIGKKYSIMAVGV